MKNYEQLVKEYLVLFKGNFNNMNHYFLAQKNKGGFSEDHYDMLNEASMSLEGKEEEGDVKDNQNGDKD